MKRKGLLIIAHGSKSAIANSEFNDIVAIIDMQTEQFIVEKAFLELVEPDIPNGVETLVQQDVNEIIVIPYFLFNGRHSQKDIPNIIALLKERYPNVTFSIADALGVNKDICKLMIDKAEKIANA